MMKLILSEWLKTKRTAVRWLTFWMPVIYAALIIGYVALRGIDNNTQTLVFQIFFEAWTAFVIPLGVGILSGFIVHQEELAGRFNGFLSSKISRPGLYWGKFILLFLTMTINTLIATVVLCAGFNLFPGVLIGWPIFIASAILVIFGTLPLLALHLLVSFAWGMGTSIVISISGLLMAALIGATSLGDKIWPFIPWAWPVRLAMLPGYYLQFAPGMKVPPEAISSGFVLNQLAAGLVAVTICLAAALIGGFIWFNKWEGRESYE